MERLAMDKDQSDAMNAYLGKNIRQADGASSLLKSTSEWLNNGKIRELVAIWLLRKNGPDFPVEADHTLGMTAAVDQVLPEAEVLALFEEEMALDPQFGAWIRDGFLSSYRNEDFLDYPAETIGGLIGAEIRERGFDLTFGRGEKPLPTGLNPYQYFRLRMQQTHDFEHIVTGGQFNSLGEINVTFGRAANQSRHLSPKLASALNAYMMFAGLRMVTRSLLHYPETWVTALRGLEQGIRVGLASPPFWYFKWEEVFDKTPAEARRHFGMPEVDMVESHHDSIIFREDPADLALAAE
jgi:ubiquinone biosynthesis protein Coq4